MINKYLKLIHLNEKIIKIIKYGLNFCIILGAIALFFLITYIFKYQTPIFFKTGILLLKLSFIYSSTFIILGFLTDKMSKNAI